MALPAARSADGARSVVHGQLPMGRRHVIPKDVAGAVAATNLEVPVIRGDPGVDDLDDLDRAAIEREPPRCLLTAVSGIALDPDRKRGMPVHGVGLLSI